MKQHIRDIITEYVTDYPTMTNTALADKILEDNAITGKSHRTIRYFIGEIKNEQSEEGPRVLTPAETSAFDNALRLSMEEDPDDILIESQAPSVPNLDLDFDFAEDPMFDLDDNEAEDESEDPVDTFSFKPASDDIYSLLQDEESATDAYEVKDLKYKLVVSKVEYLIDVELVDKVFCAYSCKGLNLTKTQITNNLKLTVNELSAIMTKLNLTKDSEPFGPFTDEFMEREDIYTVTVNNATSLLDIVKETDSAALEAVIKAYKKAYVEFSNKNLRHDSFIKDIIEGVKNVKINVTPEKVTRSEEDGVLNLAVVITDLHLGLHLPVFNYEIARQKLKAIAREINSQKPTTVSILMLGDTMHTISGVNHAGMWKTIESGAWGSGAIIKAFELLLEFLCSINNLVSVQSVSGNHDRTVADKELEDSNEGAALLFYMLKLAMPSIEINHSSHRTVAEIGNLNFILLHGDQGLDKKSADKIVWKYGKQDKFNLILEGHWHSRIISKEDDCTSYRKMHCPAFAPTDDYADRLGLGSVSGWLTISEDGGLPRITDIPINYGTSPK